MFSQLGDKLQDIFKDLRGHGTISETNINDALRQVCLALLQEIVDVPVFTPVPNEKDGLRAAVAAVAGRGNIENVDRQAAADDRSESIDIFDTAGRQEIDQPLIEELKRLREFLQPQEILLVADAATGQQAVSVATHFNDALQITGIVLTKLDGDARGGAALSMREVTQRPIKFAGVGEKLDQFETFVPDRLAGRILGMGDIVGLVEKAVEAVDEEEAARLERKLRSASFDFNDFLAQFRMMRKMGPLENILGMIPGMSNVQGLSVDEKQLKRTEAIVLSMTQEERTRPDILNARRRQRIARGSGSSVAQVNDLLQRFNQMRRMMKNAGKMKRMMAQMARMKN